MWLPRAFRIIPLLATVVVSASIPLYGASKALIVTGLSGSSQNSEEFRRLSMETKRLLIERGLPANQIEILSGAPSREAVLDQLKKAADGSAEDEFWLVLFGHGGTSRNGVPAFQVSGPRLTAEDLKTALDAIPARQFVFIGTSASGPFLPVLKSPKRAALSATKSESEGDMPRFPGQWVTAFGENPKASFARIGARAAVLTDEEYQKTSLAQAEHARLADPVTGTILEPPFGVNLEAPTEPVPVPEIAAELPKASEIKAEPRKPKAEWEKHPATEETKKIIAAARATPNPEGHSALVLEQRLGFTVEEDRTTDRLTYWRVYITRDEAAGEWANQFFPQAPPALTTKLEIARVIQTDGSATVYNPAKLAACTDPGGSCGSRAMAYLPDAKAGCVIEIGYRTRATLHPTLPHVSETIPLLHSAPVLKTSLEIRVPEKGAYRVKLNNAEGEPSVKTVDGRKVYQWQLGALPAAETLPFDPPWAQWQAYVGISSLPSWDEFAEWYRRLAKDSDEIDDSVKKMAAQLAEDAPKRVDKIRRDFEFVSALRYVAIEAGVQGFRPRTPARVLADHYGDCKDKANLLIALLRCQGIEANFVLLNRGASTDVNFPSWQFNHAIAFVPRAPEAGQPGDLWLDATDSVTPFGYVSPGDFGRNGLVFGDKKAEFKTVTSGACAASEICDEWQLEQDAQGWHGQFRRSATGMEDDHLRRMFRGATPAQRSVVLYGMLAQLWPEGDFSKGAVNEAAALSSPIELQAQTTGPADHLPLITNPGLEAFNAPERDRQLCLNDGQPFTLTQTVRLHFSGQAPSNLPAALQNEAAGQKLSVVWTRVDDRTWMRKAQLEFARPMIDPNDYPAVRHAVREWRTALGKL
jgi:hypothetical protein